MHVRSLWFVLGLPLLGACGPGIDSDGPSPQDSAVDDTAQSGETASPVCTAPVKGAVVLPADDAAHEDPVEWWYWTGHLQADDGRWFGFEQVFFSFAMGASDFSMAHHAILDVDADDFAKTMIYASTPFATKTDGYDLALESLSVTGGHGQDLLHGEVEDYALDLTLSDTKTPVLHHGDGYIDYDFGGNTYYYSRSRMAAEGTLQIGKSSVPVSGSAWFDHQWGSLSSAVSAGWDWFALQLDDGSELMIYVIRSGGQQTLVGGTLFDADCVSTEIPPESFSITELGSWTSPESGCTWPMGWELEAGEQSFTIEPIREDQEMYNAINPYWEGAALVSGSVSGRAYVELTGYCG